MLQCRVNRHRRPQWQSPCVPHAQKRTPRCSEALLRHGNCSMLEVGNPHPRSAQSDTQSHSSTQEVLLACYIAFDTFPNYAGCPGASARVLRVSSGPRWPQIGLVQNVRVYSKWQCNADLQVGPGSKESNALGTHLPLPQDTSKASQQLCRLP